MGGTEEIDDDDDEYVPESLRGFLEEANAKLDADLADVRNVIRGGVPRVDTAVDHGDEDDEDDTMDNSIFYQIMEQEQDGSLKDGLLEGLNERQKAKRSPSVAAGSATPPSPEPPLMSSPTVDTDIASQRIFVVSDNFVEEEDDQIHVVEHVSPSHHTATTDAAASHDATIFVVDEEEEMRIAAETSIAEQEQRRQEEDEQLITNIEATETSPLRITTTLDTDIASQAVFVVDEEEVETELRLAATETVEEMDVDAAAQPAPLTITTTLDTDIASQAVFVVDEKEADEELRLAATETVEEMDVSLFSPSDIRPENLMNPAALIAESQVKACAMEGTTPRNCTAVNLQAAMERCVDSPAMKQRFQLSSAESSSPVLSAKKPGASPPPPKPEVLQQQPNSTMTPPTVAATATKSPSDAVAPESPVAPAIVQENATVVVSSTASIAAAVSAESYPSVATEQTPVSNGPTSVATGSGSMTTDDGEGDEGHQEEDPPPVTSYSGSTMGASSVEESHGAPSASFSFSEASSSRADSIPSPPAKGTVEEAIECTLQQSSSTLEEASQMMFSSAASQDDIVSNPSSAPLKPPQRTSPTARVPTPTNRRPIGNKADGESRVSTELHPNALAARASARTPIPSTVSKARSATDPPISAADPPSGGGGGGGLNVSFDVAESKQALAQVNSPPLVNYTHKTNNLAPRFNGARRNSRTPPSLSKTPMLRTGFVQNKVIRKTTSSSSRQRPGQPRVTVVSRTREGTTTSTSNMTETQARRLQHQRMKRVTPPPTRRPIARKKPQRDQPKEIIVLDDVADEDISILGANITPIKQAGTPTSTVTSSRSSTIPFHSRLLQGTSASENKRGLTTTIGTGPPAPEAPVNHHRGRRPLTAPGAGMHQSRLLQGTSASRSRFDPKPSSGARAVSAPSTRSTGTVSARLLKTTASTEQHILSSSPRATSPTKMKKQQQKEREATKARVRARIERQKAKNHHREQGLQNRIRHRQSQAREKKDRMHQALSHARQQREKLDSMEKERVRKLQQKIRKKEKEAAVRIQTMKPAVSTSTMRPRGIRARGKHPVPETSIDTRPPSRLLAALRSKCKPTVPVAPKFATDRRLSTRSRRSSVTTKAQAVPLAESNDFRKSLRAEQPVMDSSGPTSREASAPPRLTVPVGPQLATSKRHKTKTTSALPQVAVPEESTPTTSKRHETKAISLPPQLTVPEEPTLAASKQHETATELFVESPERKATPPRETDLRGVSSMDHDTPSEELPKPQAQPRLTIPVGPRLSTSERQGSKVAELSAASSERISASSWESGLRNESSSGATGSTSKEQPSLPPHPRLTVPQGPRLATSSRSSSKAVGSIAGSIGERPTPSWESDLRSISSRAETRDSSTGLTIPKTPNFQQIRKRPTPKSAAQRDEEEMKYWNTHPFKARSIEVQSSSSTVSKAHIPRRLTTPVPFHFETDSRLHSSEGKQDGESSSQRMEAVRLFKARPMPKFVSTERTLVSGRSSLTGHSLTTPAPFSFQTSTRMQIHPLIPSQDTGESGGTYASRRSRSAPHGSYSRPRGLLIHQQASGSTYKFKARPMPKFGESPTSLPTSIAVAKRTPTLPAEPTSFAARPMPKFNRITIPVREQDPCKTYSPRRKAEIESAGQEEEVTPFRARKVPKTLSTPSIVVKERDASKLRSPEEVLERRQAMESLRSTSDSESKQFKAKAIPSSFFSPSIPVRARDPSKLRQSPEGSTSVASPRDNPTAPEPFKARPSPKKGSPTIPVRPNKASLLLHAVPRDPSPQKSGQAESIRFHHGSSPSKRTAQKLAAKGRARERMMGKESRQQNRVEIEMGRDMLDAHRSSRSRSEQGPNIQSMATGATSTNVPASPDDTSLGHFFSATSLTPKTGKAQQQIFVIGDEDSQHLQMDDHEAAMRYQADRVDNAMQMAFNLQRAAEDELSFHGSLNSKDTSKMEQGVTGNFL